MSEIPWLHWLIISDLLVKTVVHVLVIGDSRKPVSVFDAAVAVFVNVLLILALVFFR